MSVERSSGGPGVSGIEQEGQSALVGQVACLETLSGEQFMINHLGSIFDKTGQVVGRLLVDQQIVRFEIRHYGKRRRQRKTVGIIRNGEAIVPTYFNVIPATVSIGHFKDAKGEVLRANSLLALISL